MPSMEEKAREAGRLEKCPRPTFETLLEQVGAFGLYQRLMCVMLIGGSTLVCSLTYYAQLLMMLTPPLSCRGVPADRQTDGGCAVLPDSSTQSLLDAAGGPGEPQGNGSTGAGAAADSRCGSWSYDTSVLFDTIASENDWVCRDAWRPFTVNAVFWAGNIVGSWFWGILSDRLGRRPATLASFLVYAAGGALTLVQPSSFAAILLVRFLVGSAHNTVSHLPYVLVIEYCGSAYRTYPLMLLIASWGLGGLLLPWIAYAIWNWRILVVITSAPLLLALALYRYIPESASWLMVNGRGDEAREVLQFVASVNGRQLDEAVFCEVMVEKREGEPEQPTESLLHVWKHPRLMKNLALVTLLWMLSNVCFYGHSQNSGNLGSSVFVSFSLGGGVEVAAALLVPPLLQRFGRRWPMVTFLVTSGLCGVAYAVVGNALATGGRLALALAGRMLIMGAYSTCLQYGPELFPTVIRGQSLALYETMGGIAIFVSPSIVYLHQTTPGLPLLIIGALSLVAGSITTLLPETGGGHLPQTLSDGDLLGAGQGLFDACRKPRSYTDEDCSGDVKV
ncbi:solute carrier family 22 member 13-like [Amphibalanus amphitrite]|uniref:solute carrier family 22 member 13-like n=1 Tax=Amphibalanus amphitrite TaxID=1232801 RepID=UPI001C90AA00|nr:solute carrier family 22 member 13-like [Amphibalanus amphitrite]